jgi:olefin beta-lactone synthetase
MSVNIAHRLTEAARARPNKPAIVSFDGRRLTFAELESLVRTYAGGLLEHGFDRGMRALLFVPPSVEFFALTFALFRIGAVPVMIDPGLGKEGMLGAIREAEPEAMIAVPKAHLFRRLFPSAFESVRRLVTVGSRWLWMGASLEDLSRFGEESSTAPTEIDETAAILFTSGSTGAAKGVIYTHGIFDAQVEIIHREWGLGAEDVDLPAFPLFALFSTGLGVTSILPEMDASRPGSVDPVKIVSSIFSNRPTYSFGSPAFWIRVADYCVELGLKLPSLKKVFVAGAPVQPALVERLKRILPEGEVIIPYGATESLPVAWITGSEVLEETRARTEKGEGICVGRPIADSEVRIIGVSDAPIARIEEAPELPVGQVGEIAVRGRVTTAGYFRRPNEDARSKIRGPEGQIWHRMGDLGWRDELGRIWFCGRKSHRVDMPERMLCSVCCEAIFNQHPRVRRSALVGPKPAIVIEPKVNESPKSPEDEAKFKEELLCLGKASELTKTIEEVFFYEGEFPVDVRHNAKIKREILASWANARR